jgi:hypothetical protein
MAICKTRGSWTAMIHLKRREAVIIKRASIGCKMFHTGQCHRGLLLYLEFCYFIRYSLVPITEWVVSLRHLIYFQELGQLEIGQRIQRDKIYKENPSTRHFHSYQNCPPKVLTQYWRILMMKVRGHVLPLVTLPLSSGAYRLFPMCWDSTLNYHMVRWLRSLHPIFR